MARYLVIGSRGQLGSEFARFFEKKGVSYRAVDLPDIDISDLVQVEDLVEATKPEAIINCAAYTNVDKAESDVHRCYEVNARGPKHLAIAAAKAGALLVHFSTDYVYDGFKFGSLYDEKDAAFPINVYGKSKLKGEANIKKITNDYLIFRLSWVFGRGSSNFINRFVKWAKLSENLKIAFDEVSVPTWTKTIVEASVKAIESGCVGLACLTSEGYATRYEWSKLIAKILGYKGLLYPVSKKVFDTPAQRPYFTAMSNAKIKRLIGVELPSWEEATEEFIKKDARISL